MAFVSEKKLGENRGFYNKFNQSIPKTIKTTINIVRRIADIIFINLFTEILRHIAEVIIPCKAVTQ